MKGSRGGLASWDVTFCRQSFSVALPPETRVMTIASHENPDLQSELAALRLELKQCRLDLENLQRSEQYTRRLASLRFDVSAALSRPAQMEDMLQRCAAALVEHLDAAFARIWTLNRQGDLLELTASEGIYTRLDGAYSHIPLGDLKVGRIAREKTPHLTNAVLNDPRIGDKEWALKGGFVSFAGYPLLVEGRVVGVMAMFARHALPDETLDALASMADAVAQGIERKRVENDLRRHEAYSEEAQRLSRTGSFGWNVLTGELFWSAETFRILGFEPTVQPTLDLVFDRIHPADRDFVRLTLAEATDRQTGLNFEHRLLLPDGSEKHLHIWAKPTTTPTGALEFVGAVMDITERRFVEEQMRRSEADLHHAQRLTNTCSWKHDLSTGKVKATPETYRIFDIQPEEDASDPALYFGRIHPEDRPRVQELFQRCEIDKADYEADFRIVLPDGSIRHQRSVGHPVLNHAGELVEFVGTTMDTTDQQRTRDHLEHALAKAQKAEAYLVEAQRLSRTGSFSWHVATGKLFWSDETFAIYGFDRAMELTVEKIHERVHPEDLPMILAVVGEAIREEKGWELGHRILMPDGSIKHLRAVTHAEKHASGGLEYFGALMDVTASKQAQERLRLAHLELAHVTRLTTMGELAASIAHEVNQPLGAIVTNADTCLRWLDRGSPDLKEIRAAISSIVRDGHRGSEVIARVRALLKKNPPEKVLLDINAVVREIVGMVEPNLRSAVLEFGLTENLPFVFGDRVLIQQVLLNLILNAIDAMKSVTDRPCLLGIRTEAHDEGGVAVSVEDAGAGILPEQMDRIFTAFCTTKSGGLGLGLSLSRSIIEDHGGRLWFVPNETHGVTFRFTLPAQHDLAP